MPDMSRWELLAVAITVVVLGATGVVLATALSGDDPPAPVREAGRALSGPRSSRG
jgi:hypothetical protein